MTSRGLPSEQQPPAAGSLRAIAFVAACAAVAGLGPAGAADDAKQRRYGQHLAAECAACHRPDGADGGIPSITGWDAATFIATMMFYKNGARTNPVMVSVAGSLSDEQIAALAAYYASLPKPARADGRPAPR